jgi:hypothetical protein
VGFAITDKIRDAITVVPAASWVCAIDADGGVRPGGDVTELPGLLDLNHWPAGMRVIVRRERPHPGAQLSLFEEADGWRYQAFVTNTAVGQLAFLEARHRVHARGEDRIRHAKDSGLGWLPSRKFAINQTWLVLVTIAADLVAWTRLLALTGEAKFLAACEPKALRYRFLHVLPGSPTPPAADGCGSRSPGHGRLRSSQSSRTLPPSPGPPAHRVRSRPRNPENRSPAAPAGATPRPRAEPGRE